MQTPHLRRRWAATAAISCGLLLAACGSTGPVSGQASTNASNAALMVRYSSCMRSHGVPSFPDPSTNAIGDNSFGIDGYTFNLPASLNTQSPAYQTADKQCGKAIGVGPGAGGGHGVPEKAKQAALAHARCMREHGVPNFPDPTFSSNGGGIAESSGGGGINPRSPAFQQAQKICEPH
jgi:hypothetical protein